MTNFNVNQVGTVIHMHAKMLMNVWTISTRFFFKDRILSAKIVYGSAF